MLGSNVPANPSKKGGLALLFKYAGDWACECAQTYITLSRRWKVKSISEEEVASFRSAWEKSKVKEVVAHVPLLVNLASPDRQLWKKSIERLSSEIVLANQLGVKYLVLHPGFYGNSSRSEGIKRIIEGLDSAFGVVDERVHSMVLLETMAGQGTSIGFFEEIARIIKTVEDRKRVHVCFDTSHVFSAGHDLRGYKGCDTVLRKFDRIVGLDRVKVVHLNDCKTDLGSRVDRHALIGEGKLGLQVFHAFMRDERFQEVPKIVEIPERSEKKVMQQLDLLRKLKETSKPIAESKAIYAQSTLNDLGCSTEEA